MNHTWKYDSDKVLEVDADAVKKCVNAVVENIENAQEKIKDSDSLSEADKESIVALLDDGKSLVQQAGDDVIANPTNLMEMKYLPDLENMYLEMKDIYRKLEDEGNEEALSDLKNALTEIHPHFADTELYDDKHMDLDAIRAEVEDKRSEALNVEGLDSDVIAELEDIFDDSLALIDKAKAESDADDSARLRYSKYYSEFKEIRTRMYDLIQELDEEDRKNLLEALDYGDGEHCQSKGKHRHKYFGGDKNRDADISTESVLFN